MKIFTFVIWPFLVWNSKKIVTMLIIEWNHRSHETSMIQSCSHSMNQRLNMFFKQSLPFLVNRLRLIIDWAHLIHKKLSCPRLQNRNALSPALQLLELNLLCLSEFWFVNARQLRTYLNFWLFDSNVSGSLVSKTHIYINTINPCI